VLGAFSVLASMGRRDGRAGSRPYSTALERGCLKLKERLPLQERLPLPIIGARSAVVAQSRVQCRCTIQRRTIQVL
jgi:hypothetical protein